MMELRELKMRAVTSEPAIAGQEVVNLTLDGRPDPVAGQPGAPGSERYAGVQLRIPVELLTAGEDLMPPGTYALTLTKIA